MAIDTPAVRKARGAFFTPPAVARFVAEWAIRSTSDRVLEPSCGEAAFMLASAERLEALGADPAEVRIHGAEIHRASANTAADLMAAVGVDAQIEVVDFLAREPTPTFDVAIGNPPYIRFHDFSGAERSVAIASALRQGVRLSKLASSWAAFVVHTAAHLTSDGRMGLVLPAELLAANYAGPVRRFLLERFGSVRLITFEEPVFPGVMTEALLLLCEGAGTTDHFQVQQLRSVADLASLPNAQRYTPERPAGKWTGALMNEDAAQSVLTSLDRAGTFGTLGDWGRVALGAVTGANHFFMLTPEQVTQRGLQPPEVVRTSPPGSLHLRSVRLTSKAWSDLGRQGQRTLMFRPGENPSPAALAYIREGETASVHAAYKCRIRRRWWQVPLVATPDLFITCMNADTPRLATNEAHVRHLNSVHGLYLHETGRSLATALAVASLNSATMLGAEVVGRSYGGGILKLEPREALLLPLPVHSLVERREAELLAVLPSVRRLLARGLLLEASEEVDAVLFRRSLRISDLRALRTARAHLAGRRASRN